MIARNDHHIRINLRQLTLFLLIIQSCGIRFFGGQGSILLILLIVLNFRHINGFRREDLKYLIALFFGGLFLKICNSSFTWFNFGYFLGSIFQVYLFLVGYRRKNDFALLREDLYAVLQLFFYQALLCLIMYLILGRLFTSITFSGYPYYTLGLLFFVDRIGRNTGLFWEPGVLQLILNLFLFLSILRRKSLVFLGLICLTILSTQSTTGFMVLALNFLVYISGHINFRKPKNIISVVVVFLLGVSIYSLVAENITEKFDSRNTSGLIRYRDFLIGSQLILEKPILGHGIYDYTYLLSKNYVMDIESEIFSSIYLNRAGDMSGGYTNGLLAVFIWFGIPLGILIYYLFYTNIIITEKRLFFFAIFALTLVSEPISYTPFFILFPLSILFREGKKNKQITEV